MPSAMYKFPRESHAMSSGFHSATVELEKSRPSPVDAASPFPTRFDMTPVELSIRRTRLLFRSGTYTFPILSMRMRVGVFIVAAVAAPPSPKDVPMEPHVPAKVDMYKDAFTERKQLQPWSEKMSVFCDSAREKGYLMFRAVETPPPTVQPIVPLPATVEIRPVAFEMRRTLLPCCEAT